MKVPIAVDRYVLLIIWMICSITCLDAQQASIDKEDIPPQEINNLLQGRKYTPTYRHVKGTQYLTDNWRLGSVQYMDQVYNEIPIWYDSYNDELVLIDWQGYGYGFIKMVKPYIQQFSFDGRVFINPIHGVYQHYKLGTDFVELIFDDQITYLIRRDTELSEADNKYDFVKKNQKIIIKDGVAYKINNKKSLLNVAGSEYKKAVSTYIRKNIDRMNKATELEWLQLISYYNELLQTNHPN